MSAQFNIKAADPAAVSRIERGLGLPRFVAATLVARGISEPSEVRAFLEPSLDRDWLDPYTIPGLSEVADALEQVMRADGRILVFGGVTSTSTASRPRPCSRAACARSAPTPTRSSRGASRRATA